MSPPAPPTGRLGTMGVPWVLFLAFFPANILLSYFPLSPGAKLWILFLGILLPFSLALRFLPAPETTAPFQKEFLPPLPPWAWVLLAAGAVFIRFYKLTTLSVWPNYDDGLWGFFAINFLHHWDWSPFYQDNSYPSSYAWGLALLFKCFGPSLFMVWFYPALLSLLAVPAGYAAARTVFSESFSLLVVLFLALGFWPAFVGRFGNQQVLTLLWECLWLWSLASWARDVSSSHPGYGKAALLGWVTALGFYIYISWVTVAFLTVLTLAVLALRRPLSYARPGAVFLSAFGLFLVPILKAGLVHNYGRIVHDIGSLDAAVPFAQHWATAEGYLSSLFWQTPPHRFSYQAVWGGLLDPLLGALFFLGLLDFLKAGRRPLRLWVLAALALFFIPGTLTHDVEPFRNLPMIPLLGVVCAAGLALLLEGVSPSRRWWALGGLVLVFAGSDFYHLAVQYHRIWDQPSVWKGYAKPMERYRAFQVLDRIQRDQGPGLVYSNFTPGLCDQTLSVADHAFNAAENPGLPWQGARWAAVLVSADDKPFLDQRFPGGKAYYLSQGLDAPDGGQMLWVMPVTPRNLGALRGWQAANDAFCCFPGRYYEILRDNLAKAYPAFQGDPFLESCYWEKLADLDFHVSGFKDTQKPMEDLGQGLKKGYATAHLYFRLAMFHLVRSEKEDAEKDLRKAMAAPLDLTSSRAQLDALKTGS